MLIWPLSVASSSKTHILSLVRSSAAHPLSANRFVNATPNSQNDLKALSAACVEGVRLRGELAQTLIKQTNPRLSLMVFPEVHHAGHQMWHTVDRHHRIYNGRKLKAAEPLLNDVYAAVDRQIGRLFESRGKSDQVDPVARKSTGQHASEGFCIYSGANNNFSNDVIDAKDLGRLITCHLNSTR